LVGVACLDPVFLLLIFILGASLGSFFNVIIDRLPRNKSIILPASHCDECGKTLPVYLNIPILSYILLKGKCKYCGATIHIHHLLVEIISPLIFIALFWKYGTDLVLFAKYSVLFCFLIPIFSIDLFHRLIHDKLTIPLTITGLAFALLPNTDVRFLDALVTGVLIMGIMLLIAWLFEKVRHKEGMGGGDIKLLAALATYLGALRISFVVFLASVLAIIAALSITRARQEGIPYGPFLVLATLVWVLVGNHFLGWYFSLF
jgi:leader peptidase (prepilin peptidase) / N-methyltransferase